MQDGAVAAQAHHQVHVLVQPAEDLQASSVLQKSCGLLGSAACPGNTVLSHHSACLHSTATKALSWCSLPRKIHTHTQTPTSALGTFLICFTFALRIQA